MYRFILEYTTGKYTQGCMEGLGDKPLFKKFKYKSKVSPLKHVDCTKSIGVKCHSIKEIINCQHLFNIEGMHLITRNPYYSIASHEGWRKFDSIVEEIKQISNITDVDFSDPKTVCNKKLELSFQEWAALMRRYFVIFEPSYKKSTLIIYEDLLSDDLDLCLQTIANALGTIKKDVDLGKFGFLMSHKHELFELSRTAKGEWRGSISTMKPNYFIETSEWLKLVNLKVKILNLLEAEKVHASNLSHKFPGYINYMKVLDRIMSSECFKD